MISAQISAMALLAATQMPFPVEKLSPRIALHFKILAERSTAGEGGARCTVTSDQAEFSRKKERKK